LTNKVKKSKKQPGSDLQNLSYYFMLLKEKTLYFFILQ